MAISPRKGGLDFIFDPFCVLTNGSTLLDEVQCRRLFDLPGKQAGRAAPPALVETLLNERVAQRRGELLEEMETKNGHWFDAEMDKLEKWAEDRRSALKAELDELDVTIKETKKAARTAPNLPTKLEKQRELRKLETKRDEAWRAYDASSREIDRQKDVLLDQISQRLEQTAVQNNLFTLHWRLL